MSTSDPIAIQLVDAITAELETLALPSHKTVKHRRPLAVLPADCPLLCVWYQTSALDPRTTERYDRVVNIGVSWQEAATLEVSTLVLDEQLSASLARNIDLIEQRLLYRSLQEQALLDVPSAWGMFPLSSNYAPGAELETGLVEGYIVTVQVNIIDTPEAP